MRKEKLFPKHYYHVYNRGVDGCKIFFKKENWKFFLRRLRHYCPLDKGRIIAYCLKPTHYHLLVHVECEDFGRKVMHPFTISYTKAINKQQDRFGHLFQGTFQAKLVDQGAYLTQLTRYIHNNSVAAGHVQHPQDWTYSSHLDYVGQRNGTLPAKEIVLGYFASPKDYQRFVEEDQQDLKNISHLLLD